jgi:hypothetical protein
MRPKRPILQRETSVFQVCTEPCLQVEQRRKVAVQTDPQNARRLA